MRGILLLVGAIFYFFTLCYGQQAVQVIDTTPYTKDIYGYASTVPIKLYLKGGEIQKVELLPNSESPHRVKFIVEDGLLERWIGVKAKDVKSVKIDATVGATLTTDAIVENIYIAAQKAIEAYD